ncbi:MAG: FAD-binding protein [Pseudomonadales bacterium]|nr:FAD-binding protein [Pseudomonadales bacterium]
MFKAFINKIRFRETYREQPIVVETADQQQWDITVDVAVAGFGGAGAAAAIEAHDNGADTLVIDRFSGGGATNISGGIYYAGGGTSIQKEAGFEDDAENMYNYLQHEVQGAVSDKTLKDFCDSSVDNFDWMVKMGVPFQASYCDFKTSYPPDHLFFYYSGNESFAPYTDNAKPAPRGHRGHKKGMSGAAIFQPLKASVLSKNISVKTETKVVALIANKEGEVIGLKAIHLNNRPVITRLHKALYSFQNLMRYMVLYWPPLFNLIASWTEKLETNFAETVYIRAKKGVIMATGGFYLNQNLIKEHAPKFLGGSPLGTITDDGSGIQMATDLGAQTELMDSASAWRFSNPPTSFIKGIMVGPSGKRVCNEMMYGAQVGSHIVHENDGKAYIVLDEKTYKAAFKDLRFDRALWFHILLGGFFLFIGHKKSPSIAGLANKLGINPQALESTVTEYNRIAASDEPDPLGKPKDYMPEVGAGPYHAIDISYDYFYVPCTTLTFGGLKINEESNLALNQEGKDIKGLYAVGRTAVGIPSKGYVSGLSIADCIYAGRKAGKHAASQK